MKNLLKNLNETIEFINQKTNIKPDIAIILGTGLGGLAKEIDITTTIDYAEIPNFPVSTVEFHRGRLLLGSISGKNVIAMQGRMHYYEGYSMSQITFPVRVMHALGAEFLIVSNACGSVNPNIPNGSIMLIDDHINLLGDNPLIGYNEETFGPRFVDMSQPYSQRLIKLSENIAKENNINLYKGIYAAMTGPSLETRAEYRMLRIIGTDVVGMSTVPECIVANQLKMEVLGLSVVTDECNPDNLKPININDILETAAKAEPNLILLIKELIKKIII